MAVLSHFAAECPTAEHHVNFLALDAMGSIQLPHCISRSHRRFETPHGFQRLPVYRLEFPIWQGRQPVETWRKPIVGPPARPFAELRIVETLAKQGWSAGWVYRPGRFLTGWEPRRLASFPAGATELHSRITSRAARPGGCWDVFGWRRGRPLFLEVKRRASGDTIRSSQWEWLNAAIKEGVPPSDFAVAEWTLIDVS